MSMVTSLITPPALIEETVPGNWLRALRGIKSILRF
jgi:hypothetical protein